jgi:hypothetical protein
MNNQPILDLQPAGLDLFNGFDTLIKDLSETDESMISGGGRSNSNSNSGRRRPRRRPKRRRRRIARRRASRSRS